MTTNLRDRGVYRLPNGRELVVVVYPDKTPVLYNLDAETRIEYELNESGRLLFQGRLTAWGVDDLLDTGRTMSNDLVPVRPADSVSDTRNETTC
ncbi:MAG: hypothetical protein ABR501_09410 [Pyrinomonadaceae bacterium]